MSSLRQIWSAIDATARTLGVIEIGASSLEDERIDMLDGWLERGHEASMGWLRKNRDVRARPAERFPWARSAISILVPYSPDRPARDDHIASRIARYALGDDYHEVVDGILEGIEREVNRLAPDATTRRYVDTGPLSDRSLAAAAGLGWIGKNAMLIHPQQGSWTFIGILLTSLESELPALSIADMCGDCTRCLDACPTAAINPDRTVDSNRCISYLTIEHRGEIPPPFDELLDGNLFGCDACQEVCPWNESPPEGLTPFAPRAEYARRPISSLIGMSQDEFSTLFRKSAIKRAKRDGMERNARLVK